MHVETANWSGEGLFTQTLLDRLRHTSGIAFVRVEDAPASRSEADYNFISNEIFVSFDTIVDRAPLKRFGLLPGSRRITRKAMTLQDLEAALSAVADIGSPDYSDDAMLQYLRTERVVPPYQTRGYKLVELVRIYEVGSSGAKTSAST
jgi:hypothetical protein